MKRIFLGALLLAASASAFATGAIAVVQSSNGGYAYGINSNYSDQNAAQNDAVARCDGSKAKYNVSGTCAIVTWYTNGCGSFAASSNNSFGWSWRNTSSEASAAAITNCSNYGGVNCQVKDTFCDGTAK